VIDAIDTAKAEDDAKADKSRIRAYVRRSGPEIAILDSLTDLIPDQDGLSILRGGLSVLLKVSSLFWLLPTAGYLSYTY
jgi:hypothetical protein